MHTYIHTSTVAERQAGDGALVAREHLEKSPGLQRPHEDLRKHSSLNIGVDESCMHNIMHHLEGLHRSSAHHLPTALACHAAELCERRCRQSTEVFVPVNQFHLR